ncbi:hypothetical protein LTR53_017580 [Teratosphaeriaceae sp. CCFEE 6253]|nr:hypothetical protein LTR53_017580 [Teratosphaeriaceae sp. CCFEE 6253]
MLPNIALPLLLATAVIASPANYLEVPSPLDFAANDTATLDKRESSFNAAIVEITFYSFIDSTLNANGDCAQNCASNGGGPFPASQGIVAHTCTNPDGSARTNSAGDPTAGGDGTHATPISAAAAPGQALIPECGVFWSPYLYKWFIHDDLCPSCDDDAVHFDLWIGGSASETGCTGICDCENSLTPAGGGPFGANNGGASCIFYDITGDLSVYQPDPAGGLYDSGGCYSNPNTVDSSNNTDGLCEVCLVNANTCTVGDTATIDSPFKKRTPALKPAVTGRAALPERTASA